MYQTDTIKMEAQLKFVFINKHTSHPVSTIIIEIMQFIMQKYSTFCRKYYHSEIM